MPRVTPYATRGNLASTPHPAMPRRHAQLTVLPQRASKLQGHVTTSFSLLCFHYATYAHSPHRGSTIIVLVFFFLLFNCSGGSNAITMLPWEVLHLVVSHLDPETLAIASCVCKLWSFSMSSDHLWKPIFAAHFPSLSPLFPVSPTISYRRLYSLSHSAVKMRLRIPVDPLQLSLSDLVFTVNMATADSPRFLSATKSAHELAMKPSGTFRFDMEINGDDNSETTEVPENMRITWIVVLGRWRGIFTMMDREEKVEGLQGGTGTEGWFSEELPSPTCCRMEGVTSGMVSDVKLGLSSRNDERRKKIIRLSVGILSVISWSYVSVEDGLRYLQHFLLPRH